MKVRNKQMDKLVLDNFPMYSTEEIMDHFEKQLKIDDGVRTYSSTKS